MLMLISPAKTLDYETPATTASYSLPDYLDKSAELIAVVKKKSYRDLMKLMQTSPAADTTPIQPFSFVTKGWK